MINGTNLALRALEPDDIDLLYDWENDQSLWRVSNTLAPFSRFAIEQYVLTASSDLYVNKELRLLIRLAENQQDIGAIDLFDFDPLHQRAGVGIMVLQAYRHMGYASEALSLLVDHCFRHLSLHQLYCNISEENETSIRLFRKHGFELTGKKLDWVRYNGIWTNELMFQLINPSSLQNGILP
jgi:diamine N-acetyltransferase